MIHDWIKQHNNTKLTPVHVAAAGYSVALNSQVLYKSSLKQKMMWEGSLHTTSVLSSTMMMGLVWTCLGLDAGALQVNRNKRSTCGFLSV